MTKTTKNAIQLVFRMLQDRKIHPSGTFDKQHRFYAENDDLINVRTPSAAWPFTEMIACRSRKYVTAVAEKFGCKTVKTLLRHV